MAENIVPIQSQSDFLAFIKDQAMPNGNLSLLGTARCCGIHHSTLQDALSTVAGKVVQTLASHGFDPAGIIEDGFPPQAVWLCIEYYAFESRAKAPMAKQIARTFGAIGVMATLKELRDPRPSPMSVALPPSDLALKVAQNIRGITDLLEDNPRLAQVLIDCAMNEVVAKALPASQLRGVAEIANEMGFRADASNRVKLGNFIKARGFEPQKETRLCNGVMTAINCYHDTPTLRDAIADFFEH
ncbi:MAG: hypothetical protein ACRC62_03585 [Microcoleus sp.]